MLIQIERSGGFAGLRKVINLNTETLPPEEASKLHKMVETSGFFNLPEKFPAPKRGADYFLYKLTVETEGRKHTVAVSEQAVPEGLTPLLQFLMTYAGK